VQRINVNTRCAWYEKNNYEGEDSRAERRGGKDTTPSTTKQKSEGEEMYALVRWFQERY